MTKPIGNRLCKKGRTARSVLFALCGVQPQGSPPYAPMNDRIFVGGGVLDAPSCCTFMLRVGDDAHIAPSCCGFVGADNSACPGPITQHLVGQGPCALPWGRVEFGSGRRGRRPLRKRILWCVGEGLCPSRGRPQGSPLRRGCKGCGGFLMACRGGRLCPPGDHLPFGGLLKTV